MGAQLGQLQPSRKKGKIDSMEVAPRRKHNTEAENYRKPWSDEEDGRLRSLVQEHGTQQWALIAQSMPGRNGKQCRERWHNQLDNRLTKDGWSVSKNPMPHTQWLSLALTLRLLGCGRRRRTGSCSRGR